MIDCQLILDGARFADTGLDILGGAPTALAELQVTWGRGTTVDQPEPASCRFVIADRHGGATFLDAVDVGARVDVTATGDISTGAPDDVAQDGSFEALPLGPPGNRVTTSSAHLILTVTTDRPRSGAQSIHVDDTASAPGTVDVPPAAFTPADPTGWDAIPSLSAGQTWGWALSVFPGYGVRTRVTPVAFRDPTGAGARTPVGVQQFVIGDGTWFDLTGDVTADPSVSGTWLGVQVIVQLAFWTDVSGTWAEQPGTWADYEPTWIDDQRIIAPADAVPRTVLVFSGRVTDLTARIDDVDGTLRVEGTAVDQLADLQNRYVGDTPWPSQTVAERYAAIISASGAAVDTRLDAGLASLIVSRRDVDNQPAGGLMTEIAQGIDGVLWSATHALSGPFLWLEDPAARATVGMLTVEGGLVVIRPAESGRAPGKTALDGCNLPADQTQWSRDVTDVITRVDATWLDQSTSPDPTEHTVRITDAPAEETYGVRRFGVSTPLVSAADATTVANRVLARTRHTDWRVEGLEYDLGLTEPPRGPDTAAALDLLDGTIRIGRAIIVNDVTLWPAGDTVGVYLEGGVYAYDGAWDLGLIGSPFTGMGQSGDWTTLDPLWRWNQFHPEMSWYELWGVTGPVTEMEGT